MTGRLPNSVFANLSSLPAVPCMVPESMDHVYAAAPSDGGVPEFLTSDQCANCHDASGLLEGRVPNMISEGQESALTNLSPYGEWRYSMMGLAGRDPIFLAQLDTESTLHGDLIGKPKGPAWVQNLCFRCHGVIGQRQFHIDRGDAPDVLLSRDELQDPGSKYGALARDGSVVHGVPSYVRRSSRILRPIPGCSKSDRRLNLRSLPSDRTNGARADTAWFPYHAKRARYHAKTRISG